MTLQYRLDSAVDGDLLVVPLALPYPVIAWCKKPIGRSLVLQSARAAIALPKLGRRRVARDHPFEPRRVVEFDDLMPVRRIGELHAQHLGILLCLLQPVGRRFVNRFRLDHSEWEIASVAQQVVDPLRRLTNEALSDRDDAAVRDGPLFGDRMRVVVPPGRD